MSHKDIGPNAELDEICREIPERRQEIAELRGRLGALEDMMAALMAWGSVWEA